MKARRKLKCQGGFTLAETLLAVLILMLVSVIVATGMPAARNAYEKVIVASNAQALLSTAATALRDELGTAWDVKIDDSAAKTLNGADGTYVTYYSANTGGLSKLSVNTDNGIMLQEYRRVNAFNTDNEENALFLNNNNDSSISETNSRRLVAEKAGPGDTSGNLIVSYEKVAYTNGCVVFTNLHVGSGAYPNLASVDTLTIPVVSAVTA